MRHGACNIVSASLLNVTLQLLKKSSSRKDYRRRKKQLPSRMSYLCLLLYSYKDLERRELNNYQWYVCKNDETLDQVAEYLKKDEFPRLVSSESIIAEIGFGMIGTD